MSFRATGNRIYCAFYILLIITACSQDSRFTADPNDSVQVAQGKSVYDAHCASCHGVNLEGQENWRKRKPDGRLPAPPHDDTGHTWHHPDKMLVGIITNGLVPPYAPEGYETDMQAWHDTLTEAEIWAVLAFIKSQWSEESQRVQKGIDLKSRE